MAGAAAAQFALDIVIMISYLLKNHYRDNKQSIHLPVSIENSEFADLTDMENPEFRYAL